MHSHEDSRPKQVGDQKGKRRQGTCLLLLLLYAFCFHLSSYIIHVLQSPCAIVPTIPKYTAPKELNGRLPRRDAFAQNQTAPREHNSRLPCRDAFAQNQTAPKEHNSRLPRKNTSTWRTRPTTKTRWPVTTRKAPS